jgi:dipeptidyl aminopeptidase/acylaminoacyl peptidase
MRAFLLASLAFWISPAFSQNADAPAAPVKLPLSLDDLFSESAGAADVAVSPSGRYLAIVARRVTDDLLVLVDLDTGERKPLTRIGRDDAGPLLKFRIHQVFWKTDDRLLFRVETAPKDGVSYQQLTRSAIARLGQRLFGINRDGKSLVRMLDGNTHSATRLALNLGIIRSMLPRDPNHILLLVEGGSGRSLFKVDVNTGEGELAEPARQSIIDWWLDLDGKAIARVESSRGTIRFYRREIGEKWKKFYSVRLRDVAEQEEYEPLGPSDEPGKYYVLARPDAAQRYAVYLYDLESENFGEPVVQNPNFDLFTARISRDGKRVMQHCYLAHVRVCEFTDTKVDAHLKGLRKFFAQSANVYVIDSSDNNDTLVLFVEGPNDPPAYYYYRVGTKKIDVIGPTSEIVASRAMPSATVVEWQSSDGRKLSGYLTRPPGAELANQLPLIVFPHGGPELRDHLTFHRWPQYWAARGYAVFQPNFRGSSGFGRDFAESGYHEWGRKMQDDVTEGLKTLVDKGIADPKRTCIVGASYGGYAALVGAAFTPDLYRCAVSIAGASDLGNFLTWHEENFGVDSDSHVYWLKAIGDPAKDAERLKEVSPLLHADRIKIPVLLVHGENDWTVPISQSIEMKKALEKLGRKTELVELEGEGHSYWSRDNERRMLASVDAFLWDSIGPGFGIQSAPRRFIKVDKKK